jgi:hypothetical protein
MGVIHEFSGSIAIKPPLNKTEITFLQKFNKMAGDPTTITTKDGVTITYDYYQSSEEHPDMYCRWTVSDDGRKIMWDGWEKFYEYEEWMRFIIEHFLQPGCKAASELPFLQANHVCNGVIDVECPEYGAEFQLVVEDNRVMSGF